MEQRGFKSDDRSQGRGGTWVNSAALVAFLCIVLGAISTAWSSALRPDKTNYALRTERILQSTPLIDGHNDLPYLLRIELQNKLNGNNTFTFRDGKISTPAASCHDDHADAAR
jgi:membrane dipeptidase